MRTRENFTEEVIRYIISRSDAQLGELTILKVAEHLNISQTHLYYLFEKEKHIPPGRFLVKIKMSRSASILESQPHLSVKAIAQMMGFSSPDYFCRVFREHFGTTPGKYRKYRIR